MQTGIDINAALRAYFGDDTGGYQPIGDADDRLRRAFPHDYAALRRTIQKYLDAEAQFTVDWDQHSLQSAADLFANILRQRHPELDSVSARGLASRFAFAWK